MWRTSTFSKVDGAVVVMVMRLGMGRVKVVGVVIAKVLVTFMASVMVMILVTRKVILFVMVNCCLQDEGADRCRPTRGGS